MRQSSRNARSASRRSGARRTTTPTRTPWSGWPRQRFASDSSSTTTTRRTRESWSSSCPRAPTSPPSTSLRRRPQSPARLSTSDRSSLDIPSSPGVAASGSATPRSRCSPASSAWPSAATAPRRLPRTSSASGRPSSRARARSLTASANRRPPAPRGPSCHRTHLSASLAGSTSPTWSRSRARSCRSFPATVPSACCPRRRPASPSSARGRAC